jgi:hypothetical protein
VAELSKTVVNSTCDLEAAQGHVVTLRYQLSIVVDERRQLLVVAIDRDKEFTGKSTSPCSLSVLCLCQFADKLVPVVVVVATCAELDDLQTRRVADTAWMKETVTKQEEMLVLVSLLAEGLTGKHFRVFSRSCLPTMCASSSYLHREGCNAQAVLLSTATVRATILEREETHWMVTQVVVQLLEGIGVGDRAFLV